MSLEDSSSKFVSSRRIGIESELNIFLLLIAFV